MNTLIRPVGADPSLVGLSAAYGGRLQYGVPLARYTSARLGGPADILLVVNSAGELADAAIQLWKTGISFIVLGGGSNVLVSDAGVRGVVVINRARQLRFDIESQPPFVWAESGANFGSIARQAAARGLAGLEWATGIPGTVGGAVVGNAGAHGGDMAGSLLVAEILHQERRAPGEMPIRRETWPVERLEYTYRSSVLKHRPGAIVLSARLRLERTQAQETAALLERIETFNRMRQRTQPPGASMGSMFKNPPGDYAGRLIEAAGLKGTRLGGAEISELHANFFLNRGQAKAADIYRLIQIAQKAVAEKFGVNLELEIELVGEWH